jgi:hypothetical protein
MTTAIVLWLALQLPVGIALGKYLRGITPAPTTAIRLVRLSESPIIQGPHVLE